MDGERFLRDLEHDLSRPIAFDAIMRIRTSTGVRFIVVKTKNTKWA